MNESLSSLASATTRLEENDAALTGIDLRGKGQRSSPSGSRSLGSNDSNAPFPRPKIRRFATALVGRHRGSRGSPPPPSLPRPPPRPPCRLNYLALHNHFLDTCELPLLCDALPFLPSLETLVLFHHDVGDEGVDSLMRALMGASGCVDGDVKLRVRGTSGKNLAHDCCGLKELYLSHCNISCKGACAIANALDHSSRYCSYITGDGNDNDNKLKHLQVLSLGSNRIGWKGARSLAGAFGRYPSLQRMVLHGNKCIDSPACSQSRATGPKMESKIPIFHHALVPAGWQVGCTIPTRRPSTHATTRALATFTALILPHIRRRWEEERVLVRPQDLLRRRLREEMHGRDSAFVDSNLEVMPDLLSWMGREGECVLRTSLHSQSFVSHGGGVAHHSSGCERCRACAAVRLGDLYELFRCMPHLVALLRNLSYSSIKNEGSLQEEEGTYL